jgi:hypothetical protein
MGWVLGSPAGWFEPKADEMAGEAEALFRLPTFQPTIPATAPATAPNRRRLGALT